MNVSQVFGNFSLYLQKPHIAKCSDDDCGKEVAMGKPDTAKKSLGLKGLWDHLRITTNLSMKRLLK